MATAEQEEEVLSILHSGREVGLSFPRLVRFSGIEAEDLEKIVKSLTRKKEIRRLERPLLTFYFITQKGRRRIGVS